MTPDRMQLTELLEKAGADDIVRDMSVTQAMNNWPARSTPAHCYFPWSPAAPPRRPWPPWRSLCAGHLHPFGGPWSKPWV
jgi:hypothetical protein